MNERTSKLVDQLKDKLIGDSEEEIIKIIQEAREEAMAEAKGMLKEHMLQAILESASDEQQKQNKPAHSGGTWFQPQTSM